MKRILLLFTIFPLTTLLLVSCQQALDFAEEEPFVIVTTNYGGENTIEHFYPRNLSIDAEGNVTLYSEAYSEIVMGDDAPTVETTISESEVKHIQEMIEEYDFWKQDEDIGDHNSNDGTNIKMTVNLTDDSKTVGGYNPLDEEFNELTHYIYYEYIDAYEHSDWEEEIKEHIIEMNPDIETNP